jgi:hypothetical protein
MQDIKKWHLICGSEVERCLTTKIQMIIGVCQFQGNTQTPIMHLFLQSMTVHFIAEKDVYVSSVFISRTSPKHSAGNTN